MLINEKTKQAIYRLALQGLPLHVISTRAGCGLPLLLELYRSKLFRARLALLRTQQLRAVAIRARTLAHSAPTLAVGYPSPQEPHG